MKNLIFFLAKLAAQYGCNRLDPLRNLSNDMALASLLTGDSLWVSEVKYLDSSSGSFLGSLPSPNNPAGVPLNTINPYYYGTVGW